MAESDGDTLETTLRPGWRAHAIVAFATLATFARALSYPLKRGWDDGRFILDNPDVRHPSLEALRSIFSAEHFEAYHPLHLLSYWLDVPWTNASAFWLHAVSLVLWIIAASILLRAFAALGLSMGAAVIACCAAALHPAQVEVVSWATGRKDVLALLFTASCLLLHLRARRFGDGAAWLSRAFYSLALLSKTTTLPLPIVLALADVMLRGKRVRAALLTQLPSFVIASGVGAFVLSLWRREAMIRATAGGVADAPARFVATFGHQLGTALWPSRLAPMYSTRAVAEPTAWAFAACLGTVLLGGIAWRKGERALSFALAAFGAFLLPVANLVPMYFPFQDRYLSLPLIGLAFGLGRVLELAWPRRTLIRRWIGGALLLALSLRCAQYQGEWSSESRLWGHAVRVQPDAFYAWLKLGEVRRDRGELFGAIRAYRRALRVEPALKLAHVALLQTVALRDEKLRHLQPSRAESLAHEYYGALDDSATLRRIAVAMLELGYVRAVELPLSRSLELDPPPDQVLARAAEAQLDAGRPGLALCYARAMRQKPDAPALRDRLEHAAQSLPFELP